MLRRKHKAIFLFSALVGGIATYSVLRNVNPQPIVSPQSMATPTVSAVLFGCHINGVLQDSNCTPGATDPRVTQQDIQQTICVPGYTKTVRPPVAVTDQIKTERMSAYGDVDSPANYELDHLIPLEVGGCPDCVTNLWPQPYAGTEGAHAKDQIENLCHQKVCAGQLSLVTAQQQLAKDWTTACQ